MLRRALGVVRACLPSSWSFTVEEAARRGDRSFDAVVTVMEPEGSSVTLVVEAKRSAAPRDIPAILEQLRSSIDRAGLDPSVPMVVARYLPPSSRERLERDGVSYADATGNLRLELDRPALFLRNVGEDRDPWRGPGRPRGSLKGGAAARVVRALVDFSPPYTVPELVERSGASTGATYRVVKFLEEEGLLERRQRGPVHSVSWRRIMERWSQDYGFLRSAVVQSFLFPRGVEKLPGELRSLDDLGYVLTGSLAAQSIAPYAPPRVAMIYADDVSALAEHLGLRPVEKGANVLLAASRNDVAFVRARRVEGVMTAAPSQIAVDLLTGPGRLPSEGQAVLDWMEAHERDWRS